MRGCRITTTDVGDCVQEVWTEIIRSLPTLSYDPARARPAAWLITLARRKALRWARSTNSHVTNITALESSHQPDGDPAVQYEREEARQGIRDAVAALRGRISAVSHQVLHLRWLEGHSISEIAMRLDLTPEQVRLHDHRARQKLRSLLEKSGHGISK